MKHIVRYKEKEEEETKTKKNVLFWIALFILSDSFWNFLLRIINGTDKERFVFYNVISPVGLLHDVITFYDHKLRYTVDFFAIKMFK